MQVFSALVGGVAHDYNNLLSIFHGYTEILQMGIDPGNPLQQYLTEMMGAVERAKTLTAQLLNFSRATVSAPRELRVEKLVRDFHKMLRRMAPENIELVTELEEESGWVMADPRQIETLLSNLVLNACEAMPQGGRLCIELRDAVVAPGSRPAQEGLAPGSYLRLAVSDTGVGIPKDLIRRIFEPSFTSKPPSCNLGLGLFLSSEIVEQSGGKILVESTPGQGSTFEAFLRQIPPPQEPEAKPLPEVSFGKGENILIVEDDGPARKTLATMVSQLGYQAICAANGDEALGVLERKNEIRLVIADMVMPLLGGIRMAEIMRQRWPEIKIILTSGYAVEPPNKTMVEVFLPKPIPRGALIQNIRKLLDA
ncbi:MAG: ATP-binding protein [Verrucomicrobia bacterium]|nr:ATP-binding protein [Verrucomicrobiota bacterium]